MTSQTDIINRALGRLGESRVTSIDEASPAGRACKLHYEPTRDALLRSHSWSWAQKRVTLSESLPVPLFGYGHRYQMPSDSLRLLEVNGSDIDLLGNFWKLEGGFLLTDAETVEILYVARCEDTGLWDSLFSDAMVIKLAIRLAETLRGGTGLDEKLSAEFERLAAPLARRTDSNEDRPRESLLPWNSRFIAARGAYGGYNVEQSGYGW